MAISLTAIKEDKASRGLTGTLSLSQMTNHRTSVASLSESLLIQSEEA